MANPQKENGFTSLSNELLEKFLLFDFPSQSPIKIWIFIARKTYGYQKKIDHISLSQIAEGTDLSRQTVNESLKWLVKACLLVKGDFSIKGTVYGINKDYEQWVVNVHRLVKSNRFTSQGALTHKINITKESNTPNGAEPMKQFEEPVIQLDENGEEVESTAESMRTTFGKYPALIAKFYCELVGKTSGSRQLPAAKELLQIAQREFSEETIESWHNEIIERIKVAAKYYEIKKTGDWNLSKVAENWDKILLEWNNEVKKYQ